jgi:hypothetical protein
MAADLEARKMAIKVAGDCPQGDDDDDDEGVFSDRQPLGGDPQPAKESRRDGDAAPRQDSAEAGPPLSPFADLASLNLGASYVDDGIKVKRKLLTMPMGSPDKRQFFRAIREGQAFIARIYERPVPGELRPTPYFVDPSLHGDASLGRVLKTVRLVRCVYYDTHAPFLWAISVGQRDNPWSCTGLEIVAAAEVGYVRCVPNGRDGYAIEYPEQDLGEPRWPELSQPEWYDLAFKGRVIDSFDHEVLRELRGAG